jgi:hypothetical protein
VFSSEGGGWEEVRVCWCTKERAEGKRKEGKSERKKKKAESGQERESVERGRARESEREERREREGWRGGVRERERVERAPAPDPARERQRARARARARERETAREGCGEIHQQLSLFLLRAFPHFRGWYVRY